MEVLDYMQEHQLVNGRRRQPSGINSNAPFHLLYQKELYTTSFGDSNILLKRNDRHSRITDKFTILVRKEFETAIFENKQIHDIGFFNWAL